VRARQQLLHDEVVVDISRLLHPLLGTFELFVRLYLQTNMNDNQVDVIGSSVPPQDRKVVLSPELTNEFIIMQQEISEKRAHHHASCTVR
jgi:hypothetical protein